MKRLIGCVFLAALAVSCAGNPSALRPFLPETHGTAAEEWAPHEKTVEWWYVTGGLADGEGNRYFVQFTIFHGYRLNAIEGFVLHLALTDVKQGRHYFFEDFSPPTGRIYGNGREIAFKDSALSMQTDGDRITRLTFTGAAKDFTLALDAVPTKPAVWHGERGIISMGHADKPAERSFYYSLTNMDTSGVLTLSGKRMAVKGESWFDRQWGVFTEVGWDWFSLRLEDRRELMLFGFPKTGYVSGTLVAPDGSVSPLAGFTYEKLDTMTYAASGRTFRLGWRVKLASGEEFRILPVLADQYNPAAQTPPYWEGLCEVLSAQGGHAGWCVMETTAGAQ